MGPLRFHTLTVGALTPLTDDSVAIEFDVPDHLRDTFRFLPGQHVTLRAMIDGEDIRRSYSICTSAGSGRLRVGIKRLTGGTFSTFATSRLRSGETLDLLPPMGDFMIAPDPSDGSHRVAIAAGSGITPVLSLVGSTLETAPGCTWAVVLGNRRASQAMLLDELIALKDRYTTRLQLIHVLSGEDTGLDFTSGRIDADRLTYLTSTLIDPATVDEWFLCGPYQMVTTAEETLQGLGVEGRIHHELFFAGPNPAPPIPPPDEPGTAELIVTVDGRSSSTRMRPETSILDAALGVRPDLPFSCKGGMCASCKATLVEGEVTMTKNWALVDEDIERGFILTCQSHPTTGRVVVDFDRR